MMQNFAMKGWAGFATSQHTQRQMTGFVEFVCVQSPVTWKLLVTQLLGIKTAFYTHLLSKMYMKIPKLYLATATAQQLGKVVGSKWQWVAQSAAVNLLPIYLPFHAG